MKKTSMQKGVRRVTKYDVTNPKEIEKHGKLLENKTFRDILIENSELIKESDYDYHVSKKAKGSLGHLIEEYHFNYQPNNDENPDFVEAGVELKVTPIKKLKSGKYSAKERLVLNIINYEKIINEDFKNSSFWLKNQLLLLIYYLYEKDKDKLDYLIKKVLLYEFPEKDLKIIEDDWNFIKNKVLEGKAHELSEGDTNYLGACTKGANRKTVRSQPYSTIKARQRAFSLKSSYMTSLIRRIVNNETLTGFADLNILQDKTLHELLVDKFRPFIGLTPKQIAEKVNLEYKANNKSMIPQIISSILGIKGTKLNQIEEFSKANIEYKTVRLEPSGVPKESMSFQNIKFDEILRESWEDSFLRNRFIDTKFLFIIFQFNETESQNKNRQPIFKGIKLWNMPEDVIDTKLFELWNEIRTTLKAGVDISYTTRKDGKVIERNNFPKTDFNGVAHVRPKGRDGKDKVFLPDGRKITKQCYWLNNKYIAEILKIY